MVAAMLSLARMFGADYADGALEQLILTPQPLTLLVLSKVLAHWLTTGLPLVLMAIRTSPEAPNACTWRAKISSKP